MEESRMKTLEKGDSATRFITVGGGKGGVGKSIVSSNLAVAIASTGAKVVLVDCDLGAANQHVLFGIDRPRPGLQALLDRKIDSLQEALTPTPHPNLHLVAGTGASVGAANINHGEKQRIIRRLRNLQADVVVIDVGAGVSYNVLDFFELGAQRLLVVTPQVTSIQTAYSFLKGSVLRTLQHHAEKASELELLAPASKSGENEKVSVILARVREKSPELADSIDGILARFGAQIIGNQVFDNAQTGIFHAITRMIQDFLGINVPILGSVRASKRIRESVNLRKPMMLGPRDEDTRAFEQMAEALLAEDVALDDLLSDDEAFDLTPVTSPELISEQRSATRVEQNVPVSVTADATPPAPIAVRRPETAMLEPYMRKGQRHEVDWMGSLRDESGIRPVRIFEVAEGGAVVQSAHPLDIGQEMVLVFEQVALQPQVPVKVTRKTALGFVVEGAIPDTVTGLADSPGAASAVG